MKVLNMAAPIPVEAMYIRIGKLPNLFDISRRTATVYVQEMYADPAYIAGDDYMDLGPQTKLVKIGSFKRFLGGKHLKWLGR